MEQYRYKKMIHLSNIELIDKDDQTLKLYHLMNKIIKNINNGRYFIKKLPIKDAMERCHEFYFNLEIYY